MMNETGIMIKYVGAECPVFIKLSDDEVANIDIKFTFEREKTKFFNIQAENDEWYINLDRVEYIRFIREQ
jgi:hypothetical protein